MKVKSVLESKGAEVHTIRSCDVVHTAIEQFMEKNIGALVVTQNSAVGGPVIEGVVTERDVVLGIASHGSNIVGRTVADIMRRADVCGPEDELEFIMSRMLSRRVRHIVVVQDGVLCGIVSIGDVVKKQLEDMELEANVLRDAYRASAAYHP